MKKILIIAALAGVMGGCKTSQQVSNTDDVYANPSEERMLARQAAEEKAKREALERQQRENEEKLLAEERAKEESKPTYKDPEYKADDYYDYEYASRLNRFYNPIYGAGYYDPYYTNLYTYNQNPAFWGTSIYSSSLWMPSNGFNYYSIGFSTGWGYGGYNNFYNPYGYSSYYPWYRSYSPWGYDPWGYNAWGYNNAFMNGYNMGYYNGYNNAQWGYFNKYDANSGYGKMEYGPRGSNSGNSQERTSPGMNRPSAQYVQSVAEEQRNTPRFSSIDQRANSTRVSNRSHRPAVAPGEQNTNPVQPNNAPRNGRVRQGERSEPQQQPSNNRVRNQNRSTNQQQPQQQQQQNKANESWNASPAPANNGNQGSTPRNSGGGGNSRPR